MYNNKSLSLATPVIIALCFALSIPAAAEAETRVAEKVTDTDFLREHEDFDPPWEYTIAEEQPTVYYTRYPLPYEAPDGLWSSWGTGEVHSSGKVYTAVGDHKGIGGDSHLFQYDPETRELRHIGGIFETIEGFDSEKNYGLGKIHGRLSEGADGNIYFAGGQGTSRDREHYKGTHLFRLEPDTGRIIDLGRPMFGWSTPSTHFNQRDMLLYAEMMIPPVHLGGDPRDDFLDPLVEELGRQPWRLMVYDLEKERVIYFGGKEQSSASRDLFVDADGHAYVGGPEDGHLQKYDPASNYVRKLDVKMPGDIIRRTAGPDQDGMLYGISRDREDNRMYLFRFDPETVSIKVLFEVGRDCAAMGLDVENGFLYFLPGGKNSAGWGSPLIQVDLHDKSRKVIGFLHHPVWEKYDFHLAGSYNLMVSDDGISVYISFNGDESEREFAERPHGHGFGDQAFVEVGVPDSERKSSR